MLCVRFQAEWGHKNEQDRRDFSLHGAYRLASLSQPVQNLVEDAKIIASKRIWFNYTKK